MLLAHLNAIEKALIAQSKISHTSGHPVLRGNPREKMGDEMGDVRAESA